MITFRGWPAEGVELTLARAPIYLRVTQDETTGKIDALDQVEDTPTPSESIHVYRRVSYGGVVHVCSRGRHGRGCSTIATAEYELVPDVDGESVRLNEAWVRWCLGRPEARPPASAFT